MPRPAAPPGIPSVPPVARASPPRRGRKVLVYGLAAVVAIVAAIVVLRPDERVPGAQALRASRVTSSAVTLRWRAPPAAPDGYRIERDGDVVGDVGPRVTTFTDDGVAPSTDYTYDVIAIVEGADADPATVSVRTEVPALGEAVLDGTYRVRIRLTAASGWESIGAGDRSVERWTFSADGTRVAGASVNGTWTMGLRHRGDAFRGTTKAQLSKCWITPVTDTLTLQVRPTAGRVIGGDWVVQRFVGTLRDVSPPASSGLYTCQGSGYTARIEAVHV
jgi:hypothetical protein